MLPREDLVEIRRLRVRGSGASPGRVGSLDVALSSVDLRPPGFRGAEVLIVRELRDPAPGSVAVGRRTTVPAAWERAARAEVGDLYRHAARPATGFVATDAAAVLFADAAELLATLAIDWMAGRTRERWWWSVLARRNAIDAGVVARLMIGNAAAVPPMLLALARRGEALAYVERLGPSASAAVLAEVCRAYRLEGLIAQLASPPSQERPSSNRVAVVASASADEPVRHRRDDGRVAAPGAGTAQLPWTGHVLLTVSLAIAESPGGVPSEVVRRAVTRSWVTGSHRAAPVAAQAEVVGHAAVVARAAGGRSGLEAQADATAVRIGAQRTSTTSLPRGERTPSELEVTDPGSASSPLADRAATRTDAPRAAGPATPAATAMPAIQPLAPRPSRVGPAQVVPTAADSPQANAVVASRELAFETAFGGVFFLINVMTHLDLPGVFERGWRLASGAGSWQTLELLGRAQLDRRARRVANDPIWDALRTLDARHADVRLGAGMKLPSARRLPDAWLNAGDRPPSQVVSASGVSARAAGSIVGLASHASVAAAEWAALVTPFVRWRVRRALGPQAEARDVVAALRRPAVVFVSATHVDVELALADVSVAVRRAGLDRDPGWQPALGRVIRFEFR